MEFISIVVKSSSSECPFMTPRTDSGFALTMHMYIARLDAVWYSYAVMFARCIDGVNRPFTSTSSSPTTMPAIETAAIEDAMSIAPDRYRFTFMRGT
jgi:hypothetical protein